MRYSRVTLFIMLAALLWATGCSEDSGSADTFSQGQGGSMTRFAISNNYMYVVDNSSIQVFNIQSGNFLATNVVAISFGLETIFAKGEYLYLGANDAMYIYSIADPANPAFVFRYSHIVSCDPVVVQGNRAYVTMRSGTSCNLGVNALEIIDISDPYDPKLIANYPMSSPHGLGVYNNYLFICEGKNGLKVYDITNEKSIKQLKQLVNLDAYDVIVESNKITVTGEDGIFQFQYPHPDNVLELLSKIPVSREVL